MTRSARDSCDRNRLLLYVQLVFAILLTIFSMSSLSAATVTLDMESLIDGRDPILVRGNTLQWPHFDSATVGRHSGQNEPTLLATAWDGTSVLDRIEWIPGWLASSPDNTRGEELSAIFAGLNPVIHQPKAWYASLLPHAIQFRLCNFQQPQMVTRPSSTSTKTFQAEMNGTTLG